MRHRVRSGGLRNSWVAVLAVGIAALGPAGAARAEIRRVEAVGTAPVRPGAQVGALRDAARDAALQEAVRRVARDQLDPARAGSLAAAGAGQPAPSGARAAQDAESRLNAVLDDALGARALDYLSRFRILEDRGQRAALFSEELGVEAEYVVVVEALVDSERVLTRLQRRGLPVLAESPIQARRLRVELVDLDDYRALAAFQQLLTERLRITGAVPVEMQRGRAVLEVPVQGDAAWLLSQLSQAGAPDLSVEAVASDAERLVLRLTLRAPEAQGKASPVRPD